MSEHQHHWTGSCCQECEADVSWCDNPPPSASRELETLRAFALSRRADFADWIIARLGGAE